MDVDHDTVTTGRKRLVQIFRYLESLNQLRNPEKRQIQEHPRPEDRRFRRSRFPSPFFEAYLPLLLHSFIPLMLFHDFLLRA